MKQFKLIKEYPGSIAIGQTVCLNDSGYYQRGDYEFEKEHIENFPEFWREIKKQPLLTTYDGVEIFDEHIAIYGVCPKGLWQQTELLTRNPFSDSGNWLWFSSKEARNDYIKKNKPELSYYQVGNILQTLFLRDKFTMPQVVDYFINYKNNKPIGL